jgi:hypothetical protein
LQSFSSVVIAAATATVERVFPAYDPRAIARPSQPRIAIVY